MKICAAVFLLLLCAVKTGAQTGISGKVLDAATGQGIEYATISVTDGFTGKVLDGTTADSTGAFQVKGLQPGNYKLTASFLGYTDYVTDSLVLKTAGQHIRLGTILLKSGAHVLSGVTITAGAPVTENRIDKIVYHAANDITAQGGIALDVLKKVPQVSVDVDGNVELQGNPNIRFLINGKPSSVFGNSLTDALSAIPASQIRSIEVITSPGARYDAQGTGGIINIILKDDKAGGINGSVNLGIGTRMENTAVNLSARSGSFGMNAFFSADISLKAPARNMQDRASVNPADSTGNRLIQDGYNHLRRSGYQAGLGFDWTPSHAGLFTGSFRYNNFSNHRDGVTMQQETATDRQNQPLSRTYSTRNATSSLSDYSFDLSLNYKHKFKREGTELDISYDASYGRPVLRYGQEQSYPAAENPYTGMESYNPGNNNQTQVSVDYIMPVHKNTTFEAGAKSSFFHISSLTDVSVLAPLSGNYVSDALQSYTLDYKMRVYAGYIAASFSMLHFFDVKAGFRAEHTDINMDYGITAIPAYYTFAPSVILSHKFNEDRFVKLAYSHRIERPEYEELNPFLNRSDPYNITTGNPLLKPETGNNFELGYNHTSAGGGNLYIAVTERINSDDIKPYTRFFPEYPVGDSVYNNVSVTDRRNIGSEYNTGLMISGSLPLLQHLHLRGNLMLFNRHIVNKLPDANPVTDAFNWRLNLNADYELPHNLVAEVFGNYRSPFNNIQGKSPQFLTYTFAVRKQFRNKKLSAGLTATNLFANAVKQVTTINTATYTAYNVREIPLRSVGITLGYRFGQSGSGKSNKKENSFPDLPAEN